MAEAGIESDLNCAGGHSPSELFLHFDKSLEFAIGFINSRNIKIIYMNIYTAPGFWDDWKPTGHCPRRRHQVMCEDDEKINTFLYF